MNASRIVPNIMLALLAILFLASVYILYAGKIDFSRDRTLKKQYAFYVGLAFMLLAALPFVLPMADNIWIIIGLAVVILVTVFFLSEPPPISQDGKQDGIKM